MTRGILRDACMMTARPFIWSGASNDKRKSSANAPSEYIGGFENLGRPGIRTHDASAGAVAEQNGDSRFHRAPHHHGGHFLGADDEDVPVFGCQAGCQRQGEQSAGARHGQVERGGSRES